MFKYKFYILVFALTAALSVAAQHDNRAREILDKVASTYGESQGMKLEFKGTQIGTLWIKGEQFVLDCGGVKSWFDGQTQWSYVTENEEVNVSTPTQEEIQVINPYVLVSMYRHGFKYRYEGLKMRNGKRGTEIALIPEKQQDIRKILLAIGENNIPFYIGIDMQNGHYEEFILTNQENLTLDDEFFRFNEREYPDAEVIDLR